MKPKTPACPSNPKSSYEERLCIALILYRDRRLGAAPFGTLPFRSSKWRPDEFEVAPCCVAFNGGLELWDHCRQSAHLANLYDVDWNLMCQCIATLAQRNWDSTTIESVVKGMLKKHNNRKKEGKNAD